MQLPVLAGGPPSQFRTYVKVGGAAIATEPKQKNPAKTIFLTAPSKRLMCYNTTFACSRIEGLLQGLLLH
jgi:hypothetical protein